MYFIFFFGSRATSPSGIGSFLGQGKTLGSEEITVTDSGSF
jgi:hypothetical protein